MTIPNPISPEELGSMLLDAPGLWRGGGWSETPLCVVDLDLGPVDFRLPSATPLVIVGLTEVASTSSSLCDVVLGRDDDRLTTIGETVATAPVASVVLAQLLRGAERRSIDDGLLLESAAYSALQAGPEFGRWRAARRRRETPVETGEAVRIERDAGRLDVVLTRPSVHNALNTRMRDELTEAMRLVALDDSIIDVHLRGDGPSFCSGGDLDEFGSFADPASAHVVRILQSAGRAIAEVAERVTVHLHGSCYGSGIELAAFAGTVTAAPDARIALPEVRLGLIPGAGGTVSLPRRIGRHRTALLALTGTPVDVGTALSWGLVDRPDADE